MDYRRILNFNKKQFEYACNKNGQEVYNLYKDITEKVLFQKTMNSKSQEKGSIFYSKESNIEKGDILKFKDNYYIVINENYPENEAWSNSTLIKCNTVWNLFGETVPIVASDLSSPNPNNGSIITTVNGIINFYTKDIPLIHTKLNIDDYFYDFGGCYKLVNKFYIDGLAFLYFQRDTHNSNITYTLKNANSSSVLTEPTEAKFYLSSYNSNYYLPTAKLEYTSSDETVAIVEDNIIVPISEGIVDITATCTYIFDYGEAVKDGIEYELTQTFTIETNTEDPNNPDSGDGGETGGDNTGEGDEGGDTPTSTNTVTLSCATESIRIGGTKKINVAITDAEGNTVETDEIPTGTYTIIYADDTTEDASQYITVTDATTSTAYYINMTSDTDDTYVINFVEATLRVILTYADGTTGSIDLVVT